MRKLRTISWIRMLRDGSDSMRMGSHTRRMGSGMDVTRGIESYGIAKGGAFLYQLVGFGISWIRMICDGCRCWAVSMHYGSALVVPRFIDIAPW